MKQIIIPALLLILLIVATVILWKIYDKGPESIEPDLQTAIERLDQMSNEMATIGEVYGTEGVPDAALDEDNVATENETVAFADGAIYISAVTRENLFAPNQPFQSFVLDMKNGATDFARTNYDDNRVHLAFSPDTTEGPGPVFMAAAQGISGFQLVRTGISSAEEPLNGSNTEFMRSISYADASKRLAYVGFMKDASSERSLMNLADWSTFIYNPEVEKIETEIAHAYAPAWMPDGETVLFLRSDGLYSARVIPAVYDSEGNETTASVVTENKILGVKEGQVIATSMIDVSDDGERLLWTTPNLGLISVFALSDTDGDINASLIQQVQDTEREYYWPHFAPNGEFYAVQAVDDQGTKHEGIFSSNPELEIRKIGRDAPTHVFSLKQFSFANLFTDDWR